MQIQGLQKLTLLDFPGKTACTVFFAGCNYRCPFCHNASLVTHMPSPSAADAVETEAFFAFLQKRRGILDGVAISGGEPTLQKDLPAFISRIRAMGFAVKLDTNGTNPAMLRELLSAGALDYVAMDIKNAPEKYAETAGVRDWHAEAVRESAAMLMASEIAFEFRTTVVAGYHTPADFTQIGKWLAGEERYFLQSFLDSGDLIGEGLVGCPRAEMENMLAVLRTYVPHAKLRGV